MVSLLGAVVLFVAPLGMAPTASAAPVASVQAQAASLEAQIRAGAVRIHQLTETYDQANLTATTGAAQLTADQATLATARATLATTESALREDALESYTGGVGTAVAITPSMALDPGISSEYIEVAVGDLSDTVDQFQLQSRQLEDALASVRAQQSANQQALAVAGAARSAALREAGAEQAHLATLQTQLVQLEAASQASSTGGAGATQGNPVNNGLVTVVRAIVQAPASTAPTGRIGLPSIPPDVPTTTTPPTTPPTSPPTTVPVTGGGSTSGGVWLELRTCESGDNYRENTGNGYFGAYQFSQQTWTYLGYPGRPDLEPPALQDAAARHLQATQGWGAWPACSAALGL